MAHALGPVVAAVAVICLAMLIGEGVKLILTLLGAVAAAAVYAFLLGCLASSMAIVGVVAITCGLVVVVGGAGRWLGDQVRARARRQAGR